LKIQDPNKYYWMIPVPGEWHWTYHILKGIFAMYHESIFLPFAEMLGFSYVDITAENFHYAEDLLEMVCTNNTYMNNYQLILVDYHMHLALDQKMFEESYSRNNHNTVVA
jgi:hypothetical protein